MRYRIFSIQNINLEFKEVNLKNNNKFQLNKDALKQFLNSEAIISAVEETLKHFEDIKINNPGKSVLKDKVVNFIENTKFYSIKLSDNIYAFTIYNGNIFINKNIIDIANDNNNKQQLSALAIILVSIIHEFMHYLVRILSDDPKSKNYFLKTKKRIKKTENIKISESGIFLEDLLIGNYKGFFSIDAEFLLDINNYNDSFKIFSNKFYDNNTKYHSKADEETFLKRGFLFDDRDDSFLKRGCCLKGFMRGYEI